MSKKISISILEGTSQSNISPHEVLDVVERDDSPSNQDEFINIFYQHLRNAIKAIENSRKFYCEDGEEKITNFLVTILKQRDYTVTAETDVGGHVDIVLDYKIKGEEFKWLCEAKIANGPAYLSGGLDQLFKRYLNPRHKYCGFLIYVQNPEIDASKNNWIEHLFEHEPHELDDFDFIDDLFEFESKHLPILPTSPTYVRHFLVYLYYKPE
jgi:hypothetical protein